jgi:uncharacterized protein (TIGR02271 family)
MTLPHDPPPGSDEVADVILSEEHLLVTTERRAIERVVLQRVVVTEQRTFTVEVSHEEIRLTREPVAGGTVGQAGARRAPREPVVLILHEEQITVSRTIVPVERVTLTTNSVPGEFVVEETIRHEEIDVDVSLRAFDNSPGGRRSHMTPSATQI